MTWHLSELQPNSSSLVAIIAAFFGLGGVAYGAVSAIPGPSGVVHGCYQKRGGSLRVVPSGKRCHRDERALAFNQTGPRGAQGLRGVPGSTGATGPSGAKGPAGPLTSTLPSGQTLRGTFNILETASGANDQEGDAISFGMSLPTAPSVQIIPNGGPTTPQCSGSAASPTAKAGYLCIYELARINETGLESCSTTGCGSLANRFGATLDDASFGQGLSTAVGSWAVTAP